MLINILDLKHLLNHINQLPSEGVSEIMGEILSKTPWIGWEIGPDSDRDGHIYCALTCDGNRECLQEISDDLGLPIHESNWVIVAGSPPKLWDMYFEIHDGQNFVEIDAGKWAWHVNQSGKLEILLHDVDGIMDKSEILKIFLIGELGEIIYSALKSSFCFSTKKFDVNYCNIRDLKSYVEKELQNVKNALGG